MRLGPGVRVGPYEVVAPLGAGGMAEVYRARDTRLSRDIALKVVNEALAGDAELVRRFEQEARLAGSLNHPNVAAVYDVGLHDGSPYFVTELLQGESLRHRLSRGRIPVQTALDWASQMAQGLAAAHARGVIHRDVKPDNVFVSSDGHVKLLDFGIAKLAEAARDGGAHGLLDTTVTPTGGATRTGAVLGTPGYMSPEQVRGESVDARTDIFSLGAVVYEMLGGKRAFPGATFVESGNAILHDDPAPLPEGMPTSVAQIVQRCLEKDREQRFQSARDVGFDFDAARTASGGTPSVGAGKVRVGRRRVGFVVLAALAAALLIASAVALARGRQARLAIAAVDFEPITFRWGHITAARFLPDGRTAFSAGFEGKPEQVFVRPAKSALAQEIGLSDARLMGVLGNAELTTILHPQWTNIRTAIGTLAKVPSVGGAPRALAEGIEFADYSAKGESVVVRVTGISRTLESPPGKVLFNTTGWLTNPRFSRSGRFIAFLNHPVWGDDMGEVVLLDGSGKSKVLGRRWASTFGLAWAPDDSEIWFTGGQLSKNSIRAVDLSGQERTVYTSPSTIELQDINAAGDVLLADYLSRAELHYLSKSGTQRLLSFADWNVGVAAVSDSGASLFAVTDPVITDEAMQPTLVVLRSVDGSPAQVLARGYPLDLSRDGSLALVESGDTAQLTAVPTGPGQTRTFVTNGLDIRCARFLPGNTSVLALGRAASSNEAGLYRLDESGKTEALQLSSSSGQTMSRVGRVSLSGTRATLHLSPDARVAAALTPEHKLALVSIPDGSPLPVPSQLLDSSPVGWSSEGHLWLRQGGRSAPVRVRLFRADPRTGQVLEERTISPPDPAVASVVQLLQVSPNGEHVVFWADRMPGHLLIARGLWHPE